MFYNAECLYENDKKGFFSYMSRMNSLSYVAIEPDIVRDTSSSKIEKYGNSKYGIKATLPMKQFGMRALRDYLMKEITIEVLDENGKPIEKTNNMVSTIKYRALLQELSLFNMTGNFDRVDSLIVLMILREDKLRMQGGKAWREDREQSKLAGDPFFERNYRGKQIDKF